MGNLPSKLYYAHLENGCFRGIFSNKKIMLDELYYQSAFELKYINSYQSFSELIKWNKVFETETSEGILTITTFEPNKPLLE